MISIIIMILFAAILWFGNFLFTLALDRDSDKSLVLGTGSSASRQSGDLSDPYSNASIQKWGGEAAKEDIFIETADGVKLHSIWLRQPEPSDLWVISIHGYYDKAKLNSFAKRYYDQGYNVIAPDLRGHGQSGSQYMTMGWIDRFDIVMYANKIVEENANAQIVIFGISMGAATAMMASGEKLPPNVKCIVEDCGYSSVAEEFSHQLKTIFNMPSFPLLQSANLFCLARVKFDLFEASSVEQVKKSVTPTLFIHGDKDDFVPYKMLYQVYDAAACEKEIYVVENAKHADASAVAGQAYWDRVFGFMNKYITK